jgi:hypothetical protein
MQDATYCSLGSNGMLHARGEAAPERTGNRHGGLGVIPTQHMQTSDGCGGQRPGLIITSGHSRRDRPIRCQERSAAEDPH